MTLKSTIPTFIDSSPFPFGKFRNKCFEDIPASYFHWIWHNVKPLTPEMLGVFQYIEHNINALKKENPDLIWSKSTLK